MVALVIPISANVLRSPVNISLISFALFSFTMLLIENTCLSASNPVAVAILSLLYVNDFFKLNKIFFKQRTYKIGCSSYPFNFTKPI